MVRWRELIREAARQLGDVDIEDADREAIHLFEWASGHPISEWIVHDDELGLEATRLFASAIAQRVEKRPLAYITGHREFYGLDLRVNPWVLIPRPETEILVETVLARLPSWALTIADVGTGSGAIALALKHMRPDWQIWGSDVSAEALSVAQSNADHLNLTVTWVVSNLLDQIPKRLDAIVANLPYLDPLWEERVQAELHFEPSLALYAGEKGLRLVRQLIEQAPYWLVSGGELFVECGYDQGDAILDMLSGENFSQTDLVKDYAGHNRVVCGVWKG